MIKIKGIHCSPSLTSIVFNSQVIIIKEKKEKRNKKEHSSIRNSWVKNGSFMLCNAMQVLKIISWYVLTWKNNFNIFLSKTKAYFSDIEGGSPKPQNLFIKSCVFILTCLNFSHLQSTLCLMEYTCWSVFCTAQNSFWIQWFWCLLVLLLFFVSPLAQNGETKKVSWGKIGWIGKVGHRCGSHACFFWSNTTEHSEQSVGRCANESPVMKWANALEESSEKNSLKPNTASHNTTIWYTDTDGFLEHSPRRGSLYYKEPAL